MPAKDGGVFLVFFSSSAAHLVFFFAHSLLCHATVETYLTHRLGFNGKL